MRHLIVKKKTWFQSGWVTAILLVFFVLGILSLIKIYIKQHEALSLRNEAKKELVEIEEKRQELDEKINNLSTQEGIEVAVREQYRVVKPGEQLVIMVDNSTDRIKGDNQQDKGKNFWNKVRVFVGF